MPIARYDKCASLSDRLRNERTGIQKTQKYMANKVGVNIRTWGMYERGHTIPADILTRLEEDIDVYYVITGKKIPGIAHNVDEEKIIKQYRNADERTKTLVELFFETLKL